jgi:hypothetical protein
MSALGIQDKALAALFAKTVKIKAIKKQLTEPGYFEPMPQWDAPKTRINDGLWS